MILTNEPEILNDNEATNTRNFITTTICIKMYGGNFGNSSIEDEVNLSFKHL
jgi:hypothetical protein